MSYEEEETCMSYEEEDTCHMRRRIHGTCWTICGRVARLMRVKLISEAVSMYAPQTNCVTPIHTRRRIHII